MQGLADVRAFREGFVTTEARLAVSVGIAIAALVTWSFPTGLVTRILQATIVAAVTLALPVI